MVNGAFSNQDMGYDRSNTMFTPDGRIIQVEYAKKTVEHGSTAIGIVCEDGVLIVVDKREGNKLLVNEFTEKTVQIDEHIGAAIAGLISDGRILIEKSQLKAQQHRITFDTKIDVKSIVGYICEEKQTFTQFGGLRPFGVSLMIAGIDDKPRLFLTEPMGTFFEYRAAVFGEGEKDIKDKLTKSISKKFSVTEGLSLCIKLIRNYAGKEFNINRITGFYIKTDKPIFQKFRKSEIEKAS